MSRHHITTYNVFAIFSALNAIAASIICLWSFYNHDHMSAMIALAGWFISCVVSRIAIMFHNANTNNLTRS